MYLSVFLQVLNSAICRFTSYSPPAGRCIEKSPSALPLPMLRSLKRIFTQCPLPWPGKALPQFRQHKIKSAILHMPTLDEKATKKRHKSRNGHHNMSFPLVMTAFKTTTLTCSLIVQIEMSKILLSCCSQNQYTFDGRCEKKKEVAAIH